MGIKCCINCVAPKRYPGCHDHCTEYTKEKAIHNEEKAVQDKKNAISGGIMAQKLAGINRAKKENRSNWKRKNHHA